MICGFAHALAAHLISIQLRRLLLLAYVYRMLSTNLIPFTRACALTQITHTRSQHQTMDG